MNRRRRKGTGVGFIIFFGLVFLLVSPAVAQGPMTVTFNLVKGFNGISLPFEDTGLATAEDLAKAVPFCYSVSYWDARDQRFITHQKGSSEDNFSLIPGYPYFVTVTKDTSWTVSGTISQWASFELLTTETTDVNCIALPPDIEQTTAEVLAQCIPTCDTVWYWDNADKAYIGHPKGTAINNFDVLPGHPYLVSVTQDIIWKPDAVPPVITITYPLNGSSISTATPTITITYSDEGSGVKLTTFRAEINGQDSTSLFTATEAGAQYQVPAPGLPLGDNTVTVSISDYAGNTASAISQFTVSFFHATLTASPPSGTVPLTVNFNAAAEDPTGTIITQYRLSFGDGTSDWVSYFGGNQSHKYTKKGTYTAVLTATNARGEQATDSVAIQVSGSPPKASAEVNPSNGAVPLMVNFIGSGTDADGTIVRYEWDFEGDGVFDFSSPTTGNTSHTYTQEGKFGAVFRVTDNDGLTGTANLAITSVKVGPPGSPTATASASPTSGNAPLKVLFNGTGTDPDGTIVLYEWDFNGDGTYDWSSAATGSTAYTYTTPGAFIAAFRVTDNTGLTGVDYIAIGVGITASLSITDADRTFNPTQGQTIGIAVGLSAQVPAVVKIKNRAGAVVRTIPAIAGTVTWDGADDNGFVLPDGVYYAVLEYTVGDQTRVLDLTLTTGNQEYNVSYDRLPTTPWPFDPYADQRMPVGFTLSYASEVSVFLGCYGAAQHVKSLLYRCPFGAGHHVVYWEGTDDQGNLANYCRNNKEVIFGPTAFTLPDNGIYVQGARPVVSALAADPNYFSPLSQGLGESNPPILIIFNLSEVANVWVRIFPLGSDEAVTVLLANNVKAGGNLIPWDGRNSYGFYCPAGDYRITVQAQDLEGNTSMEMHTLVRIAY